LLTLNDSSYNGGKWMPISGSSSGKTRVVTLWVGGLGTPLIGPDGKRYTSGTEYEVASARESWNATGSPEVMIYLYDAPAQIRQFPDSEFQKMVDQLKALKRFVAKYCQDPVTGEVKGAFTNYRDLGPRCRN
jgi:hypothetical protein